MSGIASPAWAIGADEHGATLVRRAQQGFLGGTGVVGNGLAVSAVSGKLEVKVAPGELYIPGTLGNTNFARVNSGNQHATFSALPEDFTSQGAYYSYLFEATNYLISTPSSVHERIDIVCAQVEDAEYSGSLNQCVLSVVAGTPEASPKPPTPPASCVVLAEVKVPVSATEIISADVVDERPRLPAALVGQETGTPRSFLSWGYCEGATVRGSTGDFTVKHESTGVYAVKWNTEKSATELPYAVVVTAIAISTAKLVAYLTGSTGPAGFTVHLRELEGDAPADGNFSFAAFAGS